MLNVVELCHQWQDNGHHTVYTRSRGFLIPSLSDVCCCGALEGRWRRSIYWVIIMFWSLLLLLLLTVHTVQQKLFVDCCEMLSLDFRV